jgi:tol-pal system protein YbgF
MKYLFPFLTALTSAVTVSFVHAQPAEVVDLTASSVVPVVQVTTPATLPSQVQDTSALIVEEGAGNNGDLYFQLQTLQREVMELRNVVELQTRQLHELRQLSLQRYIEIDRRLASGSVPTEESDMPLGTPNNGSVLPSENVLPSAPSSGLAKSDIESYDEAYQLVKSRQYQQAIPLFERFIAEYPESTRQANAYYWLGSLYMVVDQLPQAENRLQVLLSQFPEHAKIPDASYKLATLYYKQGKRDTSRQLLEEIVSKYATTNSNTVQLASAFLRDNF